MKKLWKPDLDVNANLRRALPKLAAVYFKSGHRIFEKDRDWEDVHKFRIATKRFRYTLELFNEQYGPGLQKRIEELKQLQTLLGDANDFVATAALLESLPDTEDLRAELAKKAAGKLKKARTWWRTNLGTESSGHLWTSYLQRLARHDTDGDKPASPKKTSPKQAR